MNKNAIVLSVTLLSTPLAAQTKEEDGLLEAPKQDGQAPSAESEALKPKNDLPPERDDGKKDVSATSLDAKVAAAAGDQIIMIISGSSEVAELFVAASSRAAFDELVKEHKPILLSRSQDTAFSDKSVAPDWAIVVLKVFRGQDVVNLRDSTIRSVSWTAAGISSAPNLPVDDAIADETTLGARWTLERVSSREWHDVRDGVVAAFTVARNDELPSMTFYARRSNWVEPCGIEIAETGLGFWIPIGLTATQFNAGTNGLALAAMPINAAIGYRFYPWGQMVSMSAFVSPIGVLGKEVKLTNNDGVTYVPSAGAGVIVGLLDWANLSVSYHVDFTTGSELFDLSKQPGFYLGIGPGPDLLRALSN